MDLRLSLLNYLYLVWWTRNPASRPGRRPIWRSRRARRRRAPLPPPRTPPAQPSSSRRSRPATAATMAAPSPASSCWPPSSSSARTTTTAAAWRTARRRRHPPSRRLPRCPCIYMQLYVLTLILFDHQYIFLALSKLQINRASLAIATTTSTENEASKMQHIYETSIDPRGVQLQRHSTIGSHALYMHICRHGMLDTIYSSWSKRTVALLGYRDNLCVHVYSVHSKISAVLALFMFNVWPFVLFEKRLWLVFLLLLNDKNMNNTLCVTNFLNIFHKFFK